MTTHRPMTSKNRAPRSEGRAAPRRTMPGASAQANCERYRTLAEARARAGDRIEAERCYQHAEHYQRLLNGTAA